MGDPGGKSERDTDAGSVEVDAFLRAVARVSRMSPRSLGSTAIESSPAEPNLTGRTLLHFHIVELLGAGGMGVVYKAIDETLRRPVAIKVLSARLVGDARHREMLMREARSAAAVSHPNIAAIHEMREGPDGAFFVMELIEGETLRARLARTGPLSVTEALRIAFDIARGLARAHASNLVHRDLKCENVMLTPDGHVKLLDFGLATVQGEEDEGDGDRPFPSGEAIAVASAAVALAPTMPATPTPTTGGRVAGTPASMAPEQARGEAVDARADVYGFGVVLYEMLSAQGPFAHRKRKPWEWGGESSTAWLPRRPLRELAPKVPREVENLVTRCLAYAKEQRPRDGTALAAQIEAYRERRSRRGPVLATVATLAAAFVAAAVVLGAGSRRSGTGPSAASVSPAVSASVAPSAPEGVLRALTNDAPSEHLERRWTPFSVSDDARRVAYFGLGRLRIHDLRTETDEVIPSPDGTDVFSALFLGEGKAERLFVQTTRSTWSVHPETKQATKIVDDPLQFVTMSADGHYVEWLRSDKKRSVGVFGRTDTTTGVATDLGDIPDTGDAPLFWLSPDGSLLAWVISERLSAARLVLARSDAPLDVHDILVDSRLNVGANHNAVEWLSNDRLVVSLQEGNPPTTNLWQIRVDPLGLRPLGPPEQLTRWERLIAFHLHVHRALHAISFTRDETQWDVSLAALAPKTHRLSPLRRLTHSDTDELPGTWTADGHELIFMSNHSGRWGIYVRGVSDDASLARPVVTGPVDVGWPQLILGDTALLYWSMPADGPFSLLRAPFPPSNAPAQVLFVSPDHDRSSWTAPPPRMSRFRCARQAPDCVLLSHDSAASSWTWYHLDPRDGTLSPIEGPPAPPPRGASFQLSPDGQRLATIDRDTNLGVFQLRPTVRLLTKKPKVYLHAFDADGRGLFVSFAQQGEMAPALSYLWEDGRQAELRRPDIGAEAPGNDVAVSPAGSQIAVLSQTENWNIWILEHAF